MSLKDIEKNDVDISALFSFKREVLLKGPNGVEQTVYIRIPNDSDVARARVQALRESSELRKNLLDKDFEDRDVYLIDVSGMTKEELIDFIVAYSNSVISVQVANDLMVTIPKEPEGMATIEEQEEYQKRVDEYKELYTEKFDKEMEKRRGSLRKFLESKNHKEIISLHEKELIREHCDAKFYDSYRQLSAYYGTYSDAEYKNRLFNSWEDFKNAPTILKEQILKNYVELELGADALKKSLGATQ